MARTLQEGAELYVPWGRNSKRSRRVRFLGTVLVFGGPGLEWLWLRHEISGQRLQRSGGSVGAAGATDARGGNCPATKLFPRFRQPGVRRSAGAVRRREPALSATAGAIQSVPGAFPFLRVSRYAHAQYSLKRRATTAVDQSHDLQCNDLHLSPLPR